MHSLSNCFLKYDDTLTQQVNDKECKQIQLKLSESFKRVFYVDNPIIAQEWVSKIKRASRQRTFAEEYDMMSELLGEGFFGKVYKGINKKNGEACAIKVIDKENLQRQDLESLIREIEILKKCIQHRNIVKIRDSIEEANNFYIITELIEGTEFFLYLKKACLNEIQVKGIIH